MLEHLLYEPTSAGAHLALVQATLDGEGLKEYRPRLESREMDQHGDKVIVGARGDSNSGTSLKTGGCQERIRLKDTEQG